MRSAIAVIFMLFVSAIYAQAFLAYESAGKITLRKYPIGADIRVHLKGEPRSSWESYTIWDLDLAADCIRVSETYCVPLKALDGFDLTPLGGNKVAKLAGKFFLQWVFFSGVQEATRKLFKPPAPHIGLFHLIVAGTVATVWVFAKLFLNGQKKLNKRHRLKLIDLKMTVPRS